MAPALVSTSDGPADTRQGLGHRRATSDAPVRSSVARSARRRRSESLCGSAIGPPPVPQRLAEHLPDLHGTITREGTRSGPKSPIQGRRPVAAWNHRRCRPPCRNASPGGAICLADRPDYRRRQDTEHELRGYSITSSPASISCSAFGRLDPAAPPLAVRWITTGRSSASTGAAGRTRRSR